MPPIFVIPAKAGTQLNNRAMHQDFFPSVYLLASQRNGTLYTGVTSNLAARVHQLVQASSLVLRVTIA